jgi:hypothetical protein
MSPMYHTLCEALTVRDEAWFQLLPSLGDESPRYELDQRVDHYSSLWAVWPERNMEDAWIEIFLSQSREMGKT